MLKSVAAAAVRPHLVVRPGGLRDVELVEAMHRRCSDLSLYRRFHAPLPRVSARMVRQMLTPNEGWSLLAQQQGELGQRELGQGDVVGFASVAPVSDSVVEVGLLVEDMHQGQGLGTRLLYGVAMDAASRGYRALTCLTQPDNDAVLSTVRRAGLMGRVAWHDGLLQISIPVRRLSVSPALLVG